MVQRRDKWGFKSMKALVTGGLGFIGSHTTDLLLEKGFEVRILDNLDSEIHKGKIPEYISPDVEVVKGDVMKIGTWDKALEGAEAVVHLAAKISVEQSINQPAKNLMTNSVGTANMYESIMKNKFGIRKIIVASSAAVYGEGPYTCEKCGVVYPEPRSGQQLKNQDWEPRCPKCDGETEPMPIKEDSVPQPMSIYALTKLDQEKIALIFGRKLGIDTAIFRYFNVYGPRQRAGGPYSGVVSTFIDSIKNNKPPIVFEDGKQTRDFVSVKDVARANVIALEKFKGVDVFNVSSGESIKITELSNVLLKIFKSSLESRISGEFRMGDLRHSAGDVSKIKKELSFATKIELEEGLKETVEYEK